jgi:hypothetical protein
VLAAKAMLALNQPNICAIYKIFPGRGIQKRPGMTRQCHSPQTAGTWCGRGSGGVRGDALAPSRSPGPSCCRKLTDIEPVVILIRRIDPSITTLEVIAPFEASPTQVLRSSSPIPQIPPTHRRDCCYSSISTLPRRRQPALMTSLTPGGHSIKAGTMVPWMALFRRVF